MHIRTVEPLTVLQRRQRLSISQIAGRAAPAYAELHAEASARGLKLNGPPIFQAWGMPQDAQTEFELAFCLPVAGGDHELPPLRCAAAIYEGPISGLFIHGYEPLLQAIAAAGLQASGESREVYHRWQDPEAMDNRIEIQIGLGA